MIQKKSLPLHPQTRKQLSNAKNAEIAQLVEHNLAKVRVASSSLVFRSKKGRNLTTDACPGGGMVDALVSGASVERRASSSLVLGTTAHSEISIQSGGMAELVDALL